MSAQKHNPLLTQQAMREHYERAMDTMDAHRFILDDVIKPALAPLTATEVRAKQQEFYNKYPAAAQWAKYAAEKLDAELLRKMMQPIWWDVPPESVDVSKVRPAGPPLKKPDAGTPAPKKPVYPYSWMWDVDKPTVREDLHKPKPKPLDPPNALETLRKTKKRKGRYFMSMPGGPIDRAIKAAQASQSAALWGPDTRSTKTGG